MELANTIKGIFLSRRTVDIQNFAVEMKNLKTMQSQPLTMTLATIGRKRIEMSDNIGWLTTVPATDGNFKLHLGYATVEEIKESICILRKCEKGNISRIKALERELRKRDKKK